MRIFIINQRNVFYFNFILRTTAKERAKKILDLQTENLELRDCIEASVFPFIKT